jgi:hypothetical protein
MKAPARRSEYRPFDADEDYGEFLPGERIGPPLARGGGKAILRGLIILLALGGVWALVGDQVTFPRWQSIETVVSSWMDRNAPRPVVRAASAVTGTSPPARAERPAKPAADALPPIGQSPDNSAAAPWPAAGPEESTYVTTALPRAGTGYVEPAAPQPQAPMADPADPYQVRAEAVGLHPDLSRVLLARLSPTDYRNAGIAIQTAMAETPDSAVFVWPRQRKPELALFQVRFVPGAAPGCRRYVVTVTKDGWLTTALPMEKCGTQLVRPRHE